MPENIPRQSPYDDLGFVPLDEVQNVFVSEFANIEEDIRKNGIPTDHKIFIEYLDAIRLRLLQKARFNLMEYIKKNPEVRREMREAKAVGDKVEDKSWKDRVKANREAAIQDALKG